MLCFQHCKNHNQFKILSSCENRKPSSKDVCSFGWKICTKYGKIITNSPYASWQTHTLCLSIVRQDLNGWGSRTHPNSWLSATGGGGARDLPLNFQKTMERTIETIAYCLKNNNLLSFAPLLKFFLAENESPKTNFYSDYINLEMQLMKLGSNRQSMETSPYNDFFKYCDVFGTEI